MESEYMENDCTYKNETNYKAQWSVQNQVNNWWDTRKEKKYTRYVWLFYIYYMDKREETKLPVASLFPFYEFTGWQSM